MRVGLKYHINYPNAKETGLRMLESLDRHGVEVEYLGLEVSSEIPDVPHENMVDKLKGLDLLLSVGGDGTLLSSARIACYADVPVLGINAGTFGFLTEATSREVDAVAERIISGDYRIDERRMIGASFQHEGRKREYIGLNDVIIHRHALSRIITLMAYIGGKEIATYEGDGLIVSTPTGSTAYNLSAGGTIVHPNVDCLLLTPICPHNICVRPMVIAPDSEVKIVPRFPGLPTMVNITFDGQKSENLTEEEPIHVAYSDLRCRLIRLQDEDFFSLIRRKLNWGAVIR
jgi:NAD+ kinase